MKIFSNPLIASFLALAASVISSRITGRPSKSIGRLERYPLKKRTWSNPHQGEKECARRMRQIEHDMLTEANGFKRRPLEVHTGLGGGKVYYDGKAIGTFKNLHIQPSNV